MVYLRDDSLSLFNHQVAIYRAFGKMSSDYRAIPNVRVAAFKHINTGCQPYVLTSDDLNYVTSLFGLRKPQDVRAVDVRHRMSFYGCIELLYPGIYEAMDLIRTECPVSVDLTVKPWCGRKVIVALGDGDPGAAAQKYFSVPYPDGDFPDQLLSDVNDAGIAVNTICVDAFCGYHIWQCGGFVDPRFYDIWPSCKYLYKTPRPHPPVRNIATGAGIMEKLRLVPEARTTAESDDRPQLNSPATPIVKVTSAQLSPPPRG